MIVFTPLALGLAAWAINSYAQRRHEERRLSDGARTFCLLAFMLCAGFSVLASLTIITLLIGSNA